MHTASNRRRLLAVVDEFIISPKLVKRLYLKS